MSKMSEVHLEITELGYNKVRTIENTVNAYAVIYTPVFIQEAIAREYHLSRHASIMLEAGAKEHKCSKMLESERINEIRGV